MTETEIIAFDYYDGPTEGIAASLKALGPCYFKTIAWDDAQEQRLFGVVPIVPSELELVLSKIARDDRPTTARVHVVPEPLDGGRDDDLFAGLVRNWRAQIPNMGVLLLGSSVDSPEAARLEIRKSIRNAVANALTRERPEDLAGWLAGLSG